MTAAGTHRCPVRCGHVCVHAIGLCVHTCICVALHAAVSLAKEIAQKKGWECTHRQPVSLSCPSNIQATILQNADACSEALFRPVLQLLELPLAVLRVHANMIKHLNGSLAITQRRVWICFNFVLNHASTHVSAFSKDHTPPAAPVPPLTLSLSAGAARV